MSYFVERLPARNARDIFEFESSTTEAMGAAFDQAIFENPTTAARRMGELDDATLGRPVIGERLPEGVHLLRREPESPLLTADDARAKVADSGLDLKIPDEGMRQGALDILMERKRAELERQVILSSAPRSSVPLQVLSGFAASAIDPINIASAFVPVIGEARYVAMLARAGSTAARLGVRAGVGAAEGAAGAALVEPLVLAASAQDQADYDMADSLANIAFGTILGGGLHSIGGYVADTLRARAARPLAATEAAPLQTEAVNLIDLQRRAVDVFDDSPENIQALTARQVEQDIASTADTSARAQVLAELRDELDPVAATRTADVGDLKLEQAAITRQLDQLDDTFAGRAKEFQTQPMPRKAAERAARDSIAQERADLAARLEQVETRLGENRTQEQAREALGQVRWGEVPGQYRDRVQMRADEIRRGVQQRPLAQAIRSARDVVSESPHAVRVAALRAGVAQAMRGEQVDVADLFRLASEPEQALAAIKTKQRTFDPEGQAASLRADESIKAAGDDEAMILKAAADDEQLAVEVAEQTGLKPDLSEANALASQAETYSRAWRAYALCSLRA